MNDLTWNIECEVASYLHIRSKSRVITVSYGMGRVESSASRNTLPRTLRPVLL